MINWKAGIEEGRSSGTGSNTTDGNGNGGKKGGNQGNAFELDDPENQAQVIRVIDMSNDGGPAGNHHALNYYDAPNFDSGNRMSGPGCKYITGLDPTTVVGDECGVETLYVGVSAGNAGCDADDDGSPGPGHPENQCFKPGGTVYEYLIDEAHWDATDGTCTGNPNEPLTGPAPSNSGCAKPIAQFEITDVPGGTVEKIDPRMVMTVHEAFIQ